MRHSPLAVLLGPAGQPIALPEPAACWKGADCPQPQTLYTQGSSFGTSHGEVPRCGLGLTLAGSHLLCKPPHVSRGLCASDEWLKVGLGYSIP